MKTLSLSVALAVAAVALAPVANANMQVGNYDLNITRPGFHTWVWAVTPCASAGCVHVSGISRPIAGAVSYDGEAPLVNGRYTLTVDLPEGLQCGGYYGPNFPTHETYSWDAVTLAGSVDAAFATGCGGAPAGSDTYPFTLTRM